MRSLTVIATPVDFASLGPLTGLLLVDGFDIDALLGADGNVPASRVRQAFQALTPTADLATYVNLWDRLWNDEYVAAHHAITGWATDHIPLAGGVARQLAADQSRAHALFDRYPHHHVERWDLPFERDLNPLPMPATSIYSRLDGIVAPGSAGATHREHRGLRQPSRFRAPPRSYGDRRPARPTDRALGALPGTSAASDGLRDAGRTPAQLTAPAAIGANGAFHIGTTAAAGRSPQCEPEVTA